MSARDKDTGEPMPERELIDEVLTLIVAGHETTASGLNWTWYLLSQHPQVDARLHAELDAAPELHRARAGADGGAGLHAAGHQRGAAAVSARVAAVAPHDRGGRARRLPGARQAPTCCCRCTCCTGTRSSGASRSASGPERFAPEHEGAAAALRLHALRRRPAPLHRRDPRAVRDAHAPVQGGAAATACATCPTSRSSSRRRSTCAPATRCT